MDKEVLKQLTEAKLNGCDVVVYKEEDGAYLEEIDYCCHSRDIPPNSLHRYFNIQEELDKHSLTVVGDLLVNKKAVNLVKQLLNKQNSMFLDGDPYVAGRSSLFEQGAYDFLSSKSMCPPEEGEIDRIAYGRGYQAAEEHCSPDVRKSIIAAVTEAVSSIAVKDCIDEIAHTAAEVAVQRDVQYWKYNNSITVQKNIPAHL